MAEQKLKDATLMMGDCLSVLPKLKDHSVEFVFADMPYGTSGCRWDTIIPIEPLWRELKRVITPTGVVALTATPPFSAVVTCSNLPMFRYRWVWDKIQGGNFQLAGLQPMNNVEDVLIFSHGKSANGAKSKATYHPQMTKHAKPSKSGGAPSVSSLLNLNSMVAQKSVRTEKYPTALVRFKKPHSSRRFHPTEKPTELIEYLIKTYTERGQTVLDFCMGSGSTGVAALNAGRVFVGIEKDEKYFLKSKSRLENLSSQGGAHGYGLREGR
jgi:site-specific DNA-methyltransferase (adenine-specific)